MFVKNKHFTTCAIALLLILHLILFAFISTSYAQQQPFILMRYSYKSSANTNTIYPGSRNVVLTINVLYNGSSTAFISAGCINLPPSFSITRGYSSCSPPQTPNGSTYSVVEPGDVIVFEYHIDVDSSTAPGTYIANLTIYYRVSGSQFSASLSNIAITVSQYPPISVEVVDWYWNPDAYPGSQGVYLYITLKNNGNSNIVQANSVVELPQVFTPNRIRYQFSNLGKNQTTTISLGPISIYSNALPNTQYLVKLKINATMSTDDNVIYSAQGSATFYVTVSQAPQLLIQIIDYGVETPKPVENAIGTRFYMTIMNKDFKNIRSITAYFTIQSNGSFYNNSLKATTISQQTLAYGDVETLYSPPIILGNSNTISISVKLIIFGDDNGAEFWSEQIYSFNIPIQKPSIDLVITNVYWSSGEVYAGTEGATLNIDLLNYDVIDVRDAAAVLQLPKGFYPSTITVSGINIQRGSAATLSFSGISILTNVAFGEYPAKLLVNGIAFDPSTNTFYKFSSTYTISIKVFERPFTRIFNVSSSGWVENKVYTTSVGVHAYVYLQVSSPGYRVEGIKVSVYLPKEMVFENGNRSTTIVLGNNVYSYGQSIRIEIGPIDVVSTADGLYPIILRVDYLSTTIKGGGYWSNEYYTILLPIYKPLLNISLIDYGWENQITTSETSGASAYFTLQSLSIDTIQNIVLRIEVSNAAFLDGRNISVQIVNGPIDYGSIQTVVFRNIEVNNASGVEAKLYLSAVVSSGRGSYYRAWTEYRISLKIMNNLNTFRVVALHTRLNNAYAPLLPSAREVTISITIANTKTYQVAWTKPEIVLPKELKLNDVTGTCLNGVSSGGICTIDLNVDIATTASPGVKNITIHLTYAVRSGQALVILKEKLLIPIAIASYSYYKPEISLVSVYWGGPQAPTRVLIGQRNAPFTVTVMNRGYYPISGVHIYAKPLNSSITLFKESDVCSPQLAPEASCSVTLYADLASIDKAGNILFKITVAYTFTYFGTNINDSQNFTVTLLVDAPASGRGLEIVDVSWSNNWPVYPNTENVTLVITIANRWPYRISGVDIELKLPQGFYTKYGSVAKTYVAGPINSLQQFTVTLQISVGNVKPGRYFAELVTSYVVESGSPNTLVTERYGVSLIVNDLSKSIDVVSVQWIGKTPQPPEYGAMLMIVVRNNYNPSMKGVVLNINLPKGFTSSDANSSKVSIPASNINVLQQLQGIQQLRYSSMQQYMASILLQQSPASAQSFGYGDLLYFYVKLNIVTNKTGFYVANGTLNFIDQWNNVREIPIAINISILGSAKIVDVFAPTTVKVVKGVATLDIGVANKGSAPLYNVYVYLIPYASMLIPQQAVKYIDLLPPSKTVNVSYKLVYNPISISMGGTQTYLRYMSVPFSLSLVYKDVNGNTQFFNTSIAVLIEPFIDISLLDSKATLSGKSLSISGTVANYGIASARSVVVKAIYGNSYGETLVGDIDPASQSAFRIEINVNNISSNTVVLKIVYRDEYGRTDVINYTVPIIIQQTTSTVTISQQEAVIYNHYVIIAIIATFLTVIGYFLYRYVKIHAKAIEGSIERIKCR
ncbi:hypothetical protein QPL79_02240 [Ignisphaera sp. 4213-co]|uniref:CARDB domain-containing protein n=1 Tax=Ignisphaera cupida TaxID=3050454 RepID=A0ABD4Z4Q4_9CREN|nr:hypothetical protein [Ignisphaera sp. 4213-co]MDK6028184.1 hypothetical protein [Ignisphaera sp. 4213-co]